MPDRPDDLSPRLQAEREKLESFLLEVDDVIRAMNFRVNRSVDEMLEDVLRNQLRQFGRVLEKELQRLFEDAIASATRGGSAGSGGGFDSILSGESSSRSQDRGVSSTLQRGVDLFRILEQARRNL